MARYVIDDPVPAARPPEEAPRRKGVLTPRRVAVLATLAFLLFRLRRHLRLAREFFRYRRRLKLALSLLVLLRGLRRS